MRTFASESDNIANELESAAAHLKQLLYDAQEYMQDQSGQTAISIVEELIEETTVAVGFTRFLAEQMVKSAQLLEDSNTLL